MTPWLHIVGAGAAGSAFVERIAQQGKLPGDVIISDPDPAGLGYKGFGFWFSEDERALLKPEHSWRSWAFSQSDQVVQHRGMKFSYGYRTGSHLLASQQSLIESHPQIHFSDEMVVTPPTAKFVVDARAVSPERHIINQCFVGWFVDTITPHGFEEVQLMADLSASEDGVEFRYLLPLSSTKLLVEYTQFTARNRDYHHLESRLEAWMKHHLPEQTRRLRQERACIPMGLKGQENHLGYPLGVRGGELRDSSGYSYRNSVKEAARIVDSLLAGRGLPTKQNRPFQTWMDARLLWIIEHRPEALPTIFAGLAQHMAADRFASFMSDNALGDSLSAILAAPKRPFLRSLLGAF